MTQLTLGLDRDSGVIAHLFDERDPAVKKMLAMAIAACKSIINTLEFVAKDLLITLTSQNGY